MPLNMTEIFHNRDVLVFSKGDAYTVTPGPLMLASGWNGGVGVRWITGVNDERTVEISDGRYGGVLLYGSNEVPDMHTGLTTNQLMHKFAVILAGGNLLSTTSYERYTWASRQAGPLVPLVYAPNDILYFSLRGLWTKEDEATLAGKPWAPNFFTGFVAQLPKSNNNYYLGIQTGL